MSWLAERTASWTRCKSSFIHFGFSQGFQIFDFSPSLFFPRKGYNCTTTTATAAHMANMYEILGWLGLVKTPSQWIFDFLF